MEDRKRSTNLLDDITGTIGAVGLGVPKHMIAGYFLARYFARKKEEAARVEIENGLNEHEKEYGRTPAFLEALAEYESVYGPRKNTIPASEAVTHQSNDPYQRVDCSSERNWKIPRANVNWRRVLLIIGIVFMPYIFSWFTLRKGYSKSVRISAFIWMIAVLLIINGDIAKKNRVQHTAAISQAVHAGTTHLSSLYSDEIGVLFPASKPSHA